MVKPRVSTTRTSRGAEAPLLHRISYVFAVPPLTVQANASGRETLLAAAFEGGKFVVSQHVSPTSVGGLVQERVRATDEASIKGPDLVAARLHRRERAVLYLG